MAGTAVVVNEFGAVGIDDAIFAQSVDAENVAAPRQWLPLLHGRRRPRGDGLVARAPRRRSPAADRDRDDRARRSRAGAAAADGRSAARAGDAARHGRRDHRRGERARQSRRSAGGGAPVRGRRPPCHHQVRHRRGRQMSRRSKQRLRALNPGAEILEVSHGAIDARRRSSALRSTIAKAGSSDVDRWLNAEAHHHHAHERWSPPRTRPPFVRCRDLAASRRTRPWTGKRFCQQLGADHRPARRCRCSASRA